MNPLTPLALRFLGYDSLRDFRFSQHKDGTYSIDWFHTDPQPTEQQINDTLVDPAFTTWQEENGGDPVKTARKRIKEEFQSDKRFILLVEYLRSQGIVTETNGQILSWMTAYVDGGGLD